MKRYTEKIKDEIIQKALARKESIQQICKQYKVPDSTVYTWLSQGEKNKIKEQRKKGPPYSHELKLNIISEVKSKGRSIKATSKKYGVSQASISNWIIAYWNRPDQPKFKAEKITALVKIPEKKAIKLKTIKPINLRVPSIEEFDSERKSMKKTNNKVIVFVCDIDSLPDVLKGLE